MLWILPTIKAFILVFNDIDNIWALISIHFPQGQSF